MAKYYVELHNIGSGKHRTEYAIERSGDGVLVRGEDRVFLDRIADLLNAEGEAGGSQQRAGSSYQLDLLKGP